MTTINEDTLNLAIRKFLKQVGVTSQREIEAAVRAAFEGGKSRFVLRPTEGPSPRMTEREFRNWMTMVDVWEALSPI